MPDNDVLKVGTEFDVGPLVSGSQQAAAAWENAKNKLLEFAKAAEQANKPTEALAARILAQGLTIKETDSALQNLGLSEKEAAKITEQLTALITGQTASLAALGNESEKTAAKLPSAFLQARLEASALSGSMTGVTRSLAMVAANSETLGPIMQKAFSAFIVIAFVEILEQAIDKIGEATTALAGFGEVAQKEYLQAIAFNKKLIDADLERKDKLAEVNAVGKEGAAKYAIEVENAQVSSKRWAERLGEVNKELPVAQEELKRLTAAASRWNDPLAGLTDVDRKLAEQKERVAALTQEYDRLTLKVMAVPIETARRQAEESARLLTEQIAFDRARISAIEQIGLAEVANKRSTADQVFALQKAADERTIEEQRSEVTQHADALMKAEGEEYAIKKAAIEKRLTELPKEAATGKDVRGERVKLNAEVEALESKHEENMLKIRTAGDVELLKIDKKESDDEERTQEQLAESSLRMEKKDLEDIERAMIEKAKLRETEIRNRLETEAKAASRSEALKKASLFGETGVEQVAAATDEYEKQSSAIAEQLAIVDQLQARLRDLNVAENDPKILEQKNREIELQKQLQAAYDKYLATVNKVAIEQELAFRKSFDTITNDFNRSFIVWMDHQETFGRAMGKMFLGMENQAVQSLLKIAEQELVNLIAHQKILEIEKLDDAKAAAAGAYKSVMDSGIPFPVNFAIAGVAAATAFAAVLAFEQGGVVPGRRGQAVPIIAHAGEYIAPDRISTGLQAAIPAIQNFNNFANAQGGAVPTSGGDTYRTVHNNVRIIVNSQGGAVDHEAIVSAVKRGIRAGSLSI